MTTKNLIPLFLCISKKFFFLLLFSSFVYYCRWFYYCRLFRYLCIPYIFSMGKRVKGKSGYIIWNIAFLCSQQIYKYKIFISWYTHFLVVFIPSFFFCALLKQHCYKLFFHIFLLFFLFCCMFPFLLLNVDEEETKEQKKKKNKSGKNCVTCRGIEETKKKSTSE